MNWALQGLLFTDAWKSTGSSYPFHEFYVISQLNKVQVILFLDSPVKPGNDSHWGASVIPRLDRGIQFLKYVTIFMERYLRC